MDVLATIRVFLQERLDLAPERVVPEATLKNLGIDSLMLLELIFECEEKLDIKIQQDSLTPTTIGDLIAIVEHVTGNASPA